MSALLRFNCIFPPPTVAVYPRFTDGLRYALTYNDAINRCGMMGATMATPGQLLEARERWRQLSYAEICSSAEIRSSKEEKV